MYGNLLIIYIKQSLNHLIKEIDHDSVKCGGNHKTGAAVI